MSNLFIIVSFTRRKLRFRLKIYLDKKLRNIYSARYIPCTCLRQPDGRVWWFAAVACARSKTSANHHRRNMASLARDTASDTVPTTISCKRRLRSSVQGTYSGSLVARHRKESSVLKHTTREASRSRERRAAISWRAARRAGARAAPTRTAAPGCSTSCSTAPRSPSASPPAARLQFTHHKYNIKFIYYFHYK